MIVVTGCYSGEGELQTVIQRHSVTFRELQRASKKETKTPTQALILRAALCSHIYAISLIPVDLSHSQILFACRGDRFQAAFITPEMFYTGAVPCSIVIDEESLQQSTRGMGIDACFVGEVRELLRQMLLNRAIQAVALTYTYPRLGETCTWVWTKPRVSRLELPEKVSCGAEAVWTG